MPKLTWFLPPDFTFTSDGPIQLGTIVAHPKRPTVVLAVLPGDSGIVLPKPNVFIERNHSHENSASSSGSISVTKECGSKFSAEVSGSGLPANGPVPVEVGGSVGGQRERTVTDSYDMAPGIVFDFRCHVIRPKRAGLETELFSHKGAFLTSDGSGEEPLVVIEVTKEELDGDLEDPVNLTTSTIVDDEYCLCSQE